MIAFIGYILLFVLAAIAACVIYFVFLPIKIRPWLTNTVHAVDHSESEKAHIDIAIDDTGTMHLVWASEGHVYYQQKSESDATWCEPERITEGEAAYIQVSGDTLYAVSLGEGVDVWRSQSAKQSWTLIGSFTGKRGFKKHAFNAQEGGRCMYLVFEYALVQLERPYTEEEREAAIASNLELTKKLFFVNTEDYGATWSMPHNLGPTAADSPPWEVPSMSVWGEELIVVWKGLKSKYVGCRSNNRGDSWTEQNELIRRRSKADINSYVLNARIARDESGIHVFGQHFAMFGGGTRQWMFTDQGVGESRQVSRSKGYFLPSRYNDGPVEVVYRSSKYYQISMIRGFFRFFNASATSEPWADLFVWSSKTGKRRLLTPKRSYISHLASQKSIAFNRIGNKLYVFWHGRKKAGRRLNQYGYEPEILYTVVKF